MTRPLALVALALAALLAAGLPAQDDALPENAPEDVNPQSTASGIQYSVLREGTPGGAKPKPGDICRVHYTGYHLPGGIFDSSVQRKTPFHFQVGQGVIDGWSEGIQLMTPGARFKFTIPPQLAYGEQGAPPRIAPSETLVFVIDLIEIFTPHADASKQKEAEGFRYEVLADGKGKPPAKDHYYRLNFFQWAEDGAKFQDANLMSQRYRNQPLTLQCGKTNLPFLNTAATMMKEGAVWRLSVPGKPGTDGKPGKGQVWILEVVAVHEPMPVPAFELPPESARTTTDSGLQYVIVSPGNETKPAMGKTVRVHYAGWLPDGKLFDSSFERGFPAEFQIGRVVQGWNEGLPLIGEGGELWLVIPPKLGYGDQATGPVPANATLVFRVKLLEVKQ